MHQHPCKMALKIKLLCFAIISTSLPQVSNGLLFHQHTKKKPNLIFLLVDDLGFNDVGFRNPDIKSPNIDFLAHQGIILNQSYVTPTCTPSRAAIMTGYYPHRVGMQDGVIHGEMPYGLSLKFPTLADQLKLAGYATHMVGKWNLGFCNWNYTPTYRGFDSFFGYYNGAETYYTHSTLSLLPGFKYYPYDFRNNTDVAWEYNGTHSSVPFVKQAKQIIENHDKSKPLFMYLSFQYVHVPQQVPQKFVDLYNNSKVKNQARRNFMGRVSALDADIGSIISALVQKGLYKNSIILFSSDNGGHPYSGANNYPLKGSKTTFYEGGTRASAFIHSPLLKHRRFIYNGMVHATDYFATLVSLGGGKLDPDIDGVDVWNAITKNKPSPRKEFVYLLIMKNGVMNAAFRHEDWKLILGPAGTPVGRIPPENVTGYFSDTFAESVQIDADPTNSTTVQLYNLKDDPLEENDLSMANPEKVKDLKEKLLTYTKKYRESVKKPISPDANADNFGGAFSPGFCEAIVD